MLSNIEQSSPSPLLLFPTAFHSHAECIAKHLSHPQPSQFKGWPCRWVTWQTRCDCQTCSGRIDMLGAVWPVRLRREATAKAGVAPKHKQAGWHDGYPLRACQIGMRCPGVDGVI
ncbi:MAG: hypothetical protein F4Y37_02765 [Caldilineaceae bacterium SB0664_bin_22]|nr:hypothetical protein [Caldilineaceae bacterium SB0664_bin_22]